MRKSTFLLSGLFVACVSTGAYAAERSVGGHIGIATPLWTITEDDTTDISDQFTLVSPIGVTVKLSPTVAVDFETQVGVPVDPDGTTSLTVAPGVVYNAGPAALGLRIAWNINAPSNVGLVPLINKGIADLGNGVTWFVEAAFPTFFSSESPDVAFNVVFHTGIGF